MAEEKIETQEELIKKQIRINRMKNITNIILIIVILAIGAYIFLNIEAFKTMSQDVCKLCMDSTGATCYKLGN
jgi:hypothetical protein